MEWPHHYIISNQRQTTLCGQANCTCHVKRFSGTFYSPYEKKNLIKKEKKKILYFNDRCDHITTLMPLNSYVCMSNSFLNWQQLVTAVHCENKTLGCSRAKVNPSTDIKITSNYKTSQKVDKNWLFNWTSYSVLPFPALSVMKHARHNYCFLEKKKSLNSLFQCTIMSHSFLSRDSATTYFVAYPHAS